VSTGRPRVGHESENCSSLILSLLRKEDSILTGHGAEALQVWQKQGASIHLIVTDVVMPVMNGPEFVRRARAGRPGVKVIYMSGYTGQGFSAHDLPSPDVSSGGRWAVEDAGERNVVRYSFLVRKGA
jgi:CheY-like chemotaxis protein